MTKTVRVALLTLSSAALALSLVGCAAQAPVTTASTASPAQKPVATASADPVPSVPTVAGYPVGEFPPVPLFQLPDLSVLDQSSASGFTLEIRDELVRIPGVSVGPAQCDAGGEIVVGEGSAYLYGDDSGSYIGADGKVQNYGDGSGSFTLNGVSVQNFGDGSGNFSGGGVKIQNFGDGSGNYSDGTVDVQIFGGGAGNYSGPDGMIQNFGDGSGAFSQGNVKIQNSGDGAGQYSDGAIAIQNFGDGTGLVNGEPVEVDPLIPVPKLGVFPPLAALKPIASCGTVITFDAGVLFDFDKFAIRADAAQTLATVADALTQYEVPNAVVAGHTDAIGSDSYNQTLSEKRAAAVMVALEQAQVDTQFTAEGYGESRPVAANEIDGQDNPAGRQLNRRVEIIILAGL